MAPSIATPMHIHPIRASRSFSTVAKFFQTPLEPISLQKSVLLQSWARVEKPNLKTSVVLAPGCLSCLEYPADDHRVWVRVP
ncbi:MAG: hypothetical protein WAX21_12670, partial [Corynebacterium casei]